MAGLTSRRSIASLSSLDGRVALVTGGAGYIGTAICDVLEQFGARVIVADLESALPNAAQTRATIEVDLSNEHSTRSIASQVEKQFGRLDVLVHAAAFVGTSKMSGWAVPFDEQSLDAWDAAMRVNLTSAFLLAQSCRQMLSRSGSGSIVLISSIYAHVAPDFRLYDGTTMQTPAAYGASKAGLAQLGRYLASVCAPRIRVNTVTPGGVWRNQPETFVRRYESRVPLQRMAREEDLQGAIAFLASDLSAYVTGHDLVVDGGWTAL